MINTSKHTQYFHSILDIDHIYYTLIQCEIEGMNELFFIRTVKEYLKAFFVFVWENI